MDSSDVTALVETPKQCHTMTHCPCLQLETATADRDTKGVAEAELELSKMGGRASYQAASELTTARHRTSRWVFSLLTKLGLRPKKGQPPLKVLEVTPYAQHTAS